MAPRATPPANKETPPKGPPPASWLRGAGLVACAAVLGADVVWDHRLDGSAWGYLGAFLVLIWGPDILIALPDLIRALFRKGS